jgi:hypothetical protein
MSAMALNLPEIFFSPSLLFSFCEILVQALEVSIFAIFCWVCGILLLWVKGGTLAALMIVFLLLLVPVSLLPLLRLFFFFFFFWGFAFAKSLVLLFLLLLVCFAGQQVRGCSEERLVAFFKNILDGYI